MEMVTVRCFLPEGFGENQYLIELLSAQLGRRSVLHALARYAGAVGAAAAALKMEK